jgi:D-amino-acid dehydrogenase
MTTKPHITVIGAGIAGLCSAYWLAQSGFQVTVIEADRYPANRTSRANGSQLSACNAQVWSTWPTIRKAVTWMWDPKAPFRISPTWEWNRIKWLTQFMVAASRGDAIERTQRTIQMALHSAQSLQDVVDAEQIHFDHVTRGILHVYSDPSDYRAACEQKHVFEQMACAWDPLTSEACEELEPTLRNYPDLVGGIHTHHDATGDMHAFCVQLSDRLQNRWGVTIRYNSQVKYVHPGNSDVQITLDSGGTIMCDGVVIANGVWAPELLAQVGDRVPIYPVKGYSITIPLHAESQEAAPWVSMLDEVTKIVCSRLGPHRLRVAGTAELCGHNWDITRNRVEPLLSWVHDRFPDVNTREYTPWAGLRPMTPDQMPVVRQSEKSDRVWLAVGFGHLGWTLSPGVTRTLVDQMVLRYHVK